MHEKKNPLCCTRSDRSDYKLYWCFTFLIVFRFFFLYNFSLLQCSGPDNMKFNITNFRTFSRFNSFANDAQWQDSRQTLAFFIEFMSNIFFFYQHCQQVTPQGKVIELNHSFNIWPFWWAILATLNLASNVSSRKLKLTSNFCLRKKWFFFCKAKKIDCRSVSTRLSTLGDL